MAQQTSDGVGLRRTPAFALMSLALLTSIAPVGSATRGPTRERSTVRADTFDVLDGGPV
jgi:hypothetical protein